MGIDKTPIGTRLKTLITLLNIASEESKILFFLLSASSSVPSVLKVEIKKKTFHFQKVFKRLCHFSDSCLS